MDKTERLLDLIALLLDANEPLSFADLREAFPDEYGKGSLESATRKWERDKADLGDLGIDVAYQPPEGDGTRGGYFLSNDDYYLPQIRFAPEEMAVLYAAGSAALSSGAFPGRADLAHALRKIAFVSSEEPESLSGRLFVDHGRSPKELAEKLEALWPALVVRKRVTLRYRGVGREEETSREVDPWGICLRRGVWVLVGYCHLRKARRTFHVDRIVEVTVNPAKPRVADYEVPAEFDVAEIAREQVWEHRFHPPLEVELQLCEELAPMAGRLFPGARVVPGPSDGVRLHVAATYLDGLLRRVLPLGEGARVLGPEQAVARRRQMLESIASCHAGGRAS
ncbi:MAG: WYL domain-containing protein [Deltaproteobacteria bacterium]|nr:WYL domain-containing protein [Deltaproteobacteria bacterium]